MTKAGRQHGAQALSPSAVTLGETPRQGAQRGQVGAKVDWFTVTWRPEPDEHFVATVLDFLRGLGLPVFAETGPGHFGFVEGARLYVSLDGGARVQVALLDWGGERMKGRARLDLSGTACARISDWQAVQDWFGQQWESTITRVDLAVDCLDGEYTVDDAAAWLDAGEFHAGTGAPPRHSTPGDWRTKDEQGNPTPYYGRTLEIGRRENGKMLRVYEKGLQLSPGSGDKWTRFEVELRNKDRDIPLDVLTRCDEYFAGAYVCLRRLLPVAGERIATHQKEGKLSAITMVHHLGIAYGKLVHILRGVVTSDELLDLISRPGVPTRLEKATLAGFNAASCVAQLE